MTSVYDGPLIPLVSIVTYPSDSSQPLKINVQDVLCILSDIAVFLFLFKLLLPRPGQTLENGTEWIGLYFLMSAWARCDCRYHGYNNMDFVI